MVRRRNKPTPLEGNSWWQVLEQSPHGDKVYEYNIDTIYNLISELFFIEGSFEKTASEKI